VAADRRPRPAAARRAAGRRDRGRKRVAVAVAQRRIGAGDRRGFLAGLAAALVLAVVAVVVQVRDLAQREPGWTDNAYGSIFYTLAGFAIFLAVAASIMITMVLYWGARGVYTQRRHAPIANVVRFWAAMVVMWVVGFGTLYLAPALT
jgi:cytochrome c oxidase subunit I+III